jgi:hypothetical protein
MAKKLPTQGEPQTEQVRIQCMNYPKTETTQQMETIFSIRPQQNKKIGRNMTNF